MTKKDLRRAARILGDYAESIANGHTYGADGVSWDPKYKEARKPCEEARALATILRQGATKVLLLALLLLTMGGCANSGLYVGPPVHTIPECDGNPITTPCTGYCDVRLPAVAGGPLTTVRLPYAVIIKDHTGRIACEGIEL